MVTIVVRGIRAHLRRALAAALAVVGGVAFLTATLVLSDSMRSGFGASFVAGNEGTAVVVRNDTRLGSDEAAVDVGTVPVALLDQLTAVPGVASGALEVSGQAQILAADGRPLGGDGPPTLADNWIDDPRLSAWRLAEGRAPAAGADPVEVVIDRGSARAGALAVGSTTVVRTPDPVPVTVVGIATFGDQDSQGPTTQVLFDTGTATDLLLGDSGLATAVRLSAEAGIDHDRLAADIGRLLPVGIEAITGADLAAEQLADLEGDFLGFFETMLLAFAAIGLLVATLTIHNTWSIIVAQRAQESALLRALGASRRQIVATVAVESLAIGAAGAAIGLGAGLALARAALWAMDSAGFGAPGGMTWSATSLAVAMAVGLVVTALATLVPAVTASRVSPLAAMRAVGVDRSAGSRLRLGAGVALAGISALAVVGSSTVDGSELALAGLGVAAAILALLLVAPSLAVPVARAVGWPIARLRGRPGELAWRNAARNPRRTAGTSTSLTIGVGVVVLFLTIASSMTAYLDRALTAGFHGDLVIEADGFSGPGLSPALAPAIEELDEVDVAVALGTGVGRVGGDTTYPTVTDPVGLIELLDPEVVDGSAVAAGETGLAVSRRFAADHGLAVGDGLALAIGRGDPVDLTVGAIFAQHDLVGDLVVDRHRWLDHQGALTTWMVLVRLAPGVALEGGQAAVTEVTDALSAPAPIDRDAYLDQVAGQLDQVLAVVFALMALAVLIAVMGIGNTMSLSIHERTRELGLLRAVGMSRSGVRAAVRWESVIVAGFGGLSGVALGTFAAWVVLRAVEAAGEIPVGIAIPFPALVVVSVLGALSGVVAGFRPARRAARTDVLDAIATA